MIYYYQKEGMMKTGPKGKTSFEKKAGIYGIKNLVTGSFYVGSTINVLRRYWNHRGHLLRNTHKNPGMKIDNEKYGINSFIFGVIEYCELSEINEKEQYYVDLWKPLYNRRIDVDNPKSGWDEEAKKKLGLKLKKAWLGRKMRPGFKEKHGAARRGILHSDETKKMMSQNRKGKPKSAEWKEKMRQRRKGTKLINGKYIKINRDD
jgi:group I intron endonuclease